MGKLGVILKSCPILYEWVHGWLELFESFVANWSYEIMLDEVLSIQGSSQVEFSLSVIGGYHMVCLEFKI